MHKIVFAAAGAVLVLTIDAWLCIRTMTPSALAGSTFNRLIVTTGANASPISHYDGFLFVSD
jgi:hypothetical protein